MTNSEAFTQEISKYLNKFINALATDKESVLKALEKFPGKNHKLIKLAIENGPETLPSTDTDVCGDVFNFIVYFSTGKTVDTLEVLAKENPSVTEQ